MLVLAMSLVLVDYFLSPVVTEKGWSFINIDALNASYNVNKKNEPLSQSCKNKANAYFKKKAKQSEVGYSLQACLKNGGIVFVDKSDFKGILMIYQYDKLLTIAKNLHQPHVVRVNKKGDIFVWEAGRERLIKFYFVSVAHKS